MNVADSNVVIREMALTHVEMLRSEYGDAIPRSALLRGFDIEGVRVPLVGPPGIFKPAVLTDEMPLSILTVPHKVGVEPPYEDSLRTDGLFSYKYRGTDPQNYDNAWLRRAMNTGTPISYFVGIVTGQYMAISPAAVIGEEPHNLAFVVADDSATGVGIEPEAVVEIRRRWTTELTVRRLHQAQFRSHVISAYSGACAVCRLKHPELLDAAHILPDGHPLGNAVVPNGLALCKLHHSAFDQNVMGIRPDLVVEIKEKVMTESDGPMLIHGLQGFHEKVLSVPSSPRLRPSEDRLEKRYEEFKQVG